MHRAARIHRYVTRDVKLYDYDDGDVDDDDVDEDDGNEDDENDNGGGWMEFTRGKSGLIVGEIPAPC